MNEKTGADGTHQFLINPGLQLMALVESPLPGIEQH